MAGEMTKLIRNVFDRLADIGKRKPLKRQKPPS